MLSWVLALESEEEEASRSWSVAEEVVVRALGPGLVWALSDIDGRDLRRSGIIQRPTLFNHPLNIYGYDQELHVGESHGVCTGHLYSST